MTNLHGVRSIPGSRTLALAIIAVVTALLACGGGGNPSACSAEVEYEGKKATSTGEDRMAAQHQACREWCKVNDPEPAETKDIAACASRCGADLAFGQGSAKLACK